MEFKQLSQPATLVHSAAVYPYSENLLAQCQRESKYGDGFSLCRIVGAGANRRLWLPRNMAARAYSDLREDGMDYKFNSSFVPRNDEQVRIVSEAKALLLNGVSFLLEASTGFGKGAMAMELIASVGKKTLVVVTKEDIKDQWIDNIEKILGLSMGKGIGLIQGDICNTTNAGIVIAFVQSISKEQRYPESVFKDFGLMCHDEIHHIAADVFSQSCFRVPAKLRLGLSATADRKDGRMEVLYAHIGPVLVRSKQLPLIPRVIIQRSPWEIPYVNRKNKRGLFQLVQLPHSAGKCGHILKLIINHYRRNQMIAQFAYSAYKKGRILLIQSEYKDHLEILFHMIAAIGVPTGDMGYYIGGLTTKEREYVKGKRILLCTYAMTADATDIPWADTLIMATPRSDVRQVVGRILREFEGKKDPVVFDIVDASSSVFLAYSRNRKKWYESIGAELNLIPD
jgi:superfamily II DNA or RNA helicase